MEEQMVNNQVQQPNIPTPPVHKSRSFLTSKLFLITLVMVVLFTTIYIGIYLYLNFQLDQISRSNQTTISTKPTPTPLPIGADERKEGDPAANWKTYTDQELGISFRYPTEWGDIKKERNTDCWQGAPRPCVHILLTLPKVHDNNILLGSGNLSYINNVVGKGAYFGHRIGKAFRYGTSFEKFARDYCTTNESERCETKTNQYGLLYTKSLETNYDTLEGLALYYFVYHPNHQFEGITLSNERFLNTEFSESSEKNLDQILSTFKFTN